MAILGELGPGDTFRKMRGKVAYVVLDRESLGWNRGNHGVFTVMQDGRLFRGDQREQGGFLLKHNALAFLPVRFQQGSYRIWFASHSGYVTSEPRNQAIVQLARYSDTLPSIWVKRMEGPRFKPKSVVFLKRILAHLDKHPGRSASALHHELRISYAGVTKALYQAVADGLAVRVPDPGGSAGTYLFYTPGNLPDWVKKHSRWARLIG